MSASGLYVFAPFRLDAATRELRKHDERIALPPRVFACLLYLIERHERAVGRDELIDALWDGRSASDVQLAQLILQCRRAVDDDGQGQRAIRTVAGFGYRWVQALQTQTQAEPDAPAAEPPVDAVAAATVPLAVMSDAATSAVAVPVVADALVAAEPVRPRGRPRRSRIALAVVLAFVLLALALLAYRHFRLGTPAPNGRALVLVSPILVDDGEARWLRLGGMDVVVERLRHNQVPVLSSEATVALLQTTAVQASEDDAGRLLAQSATVGAGAVLAIAATRAGPLWRMTASLRADGQPLREESIERDDPLVALRLVADHASGLLGHPVAEPDARIDGSAVALTLQQARAALLANDPERARALLQSNPALVANEPLLRQQLADVDIRAGRYAQARATLDDLLAHADGDAGFRARLLDARGMVAIRSGRFADAGTDFSAALSLAGNGGDAITLGRAWLGRGISRTSLQDYAGAQSDYAQARDVFDKAGDAGSVARVDSDIGALEILRGHMAQADSYLQRALERFHDFGMVQEEINALQLGFVARRAQLKNAEAAAAIERAWALRARIVSPSSRLSTSLYRVESLLSLGRDDEARALLDSLDGNAAAAAGAEGERWLLMRAEQQRAAGQVEQAWQTLAPISEDAHASADDDSVRAAVTLLRARLERALHRGDARRPLEHDETMLASPTPRTPLRLLAAANRARARDDPPAAEAAFATALRLADEQGIAQTLAAVVSDDVDYLLAAGRVAEAGTVAARVALWADLDFDCALVQLRVAHAAHDRVAAAAALQRARRLAGDRTIPAAL
ncbi:MAG: winged helix-turn-helix domain-containing protein, partial [Dokdonella sp.]